MATQLETRPGNAPLDTVQHIHHHANAATPGAVALAFCGARRRALPQQIARDLPCCPDCNTRLSDPCTNVAEVS